MYVNPLGIKEWILPDFFFFFLETTSASADNNYWQVDISKESTSMALHGDLRTQYKQWNKEEDNYVLI